MSELRDQPNLFASFANAAVSACGTSANPSPAFRPSQPAGKSFRKSLIRLGVIVTIAITMAGLVHNAPPHIAAYLAKDLGTLSPEMQTARLTQIASLGRAGVPVLVRQLANGDEALANQCETILIQSQNVWTTLSPPNRVAMHATLATAIELWNDSASVPRQQILHRLLRQSLTAIDTNQTPEAAAVRDQIAATMDRLGTATQTRGMMVSQSSNAAAPQSLRVRRAPLAVTPDVDPDWTDWPPASSHPTAPDTTVAIADASPAADATKLSPIDESSTIVLKPVQRVVKLASAPVQAPAATIAPVAAFAEVVIPPMAALADVSVFVYLDNVDSSTRMAAETELRSRGYDDTSLALARIVGGKNSAARLALVGQIASMPSVDPRPWLSYLANDRERQIRSAAIAVIASFGDADSQRFLRDRLDAETDPVVSARIRRHLDAAGKR